MEKIKFYDMKGVNCWIINLKPFGRDEPDERIRNLQDECVRNNVFGIGWWTEYFNTHTKVTLDENSKKAYNDSFNGELSSRASAVDEMSKIKCGDLAIMRLRDGHIYLGKVTDPAFHDSTILSKENASRISWMCKVEKWLEFCDETSIPSEIMGRFSQRQQATITKIANYKQRLLMLSMYDIKSSGKTDVPKVILNENNFTRALSYTDLEDLVCAYIHNKHADDGYMLLPSSGKVSRQKYEFTFVSNKSDKKPITCQVKNQNSEPIDIANYENDKDIYEKIYLFSGNNNFANCKLAKDNIEIINHQDLFDVLKCGNLKFMYDKLSKYHLFCESPDLEKLKEALNPDGAGWQQREKFSKDSDDFKKFKVGTRNTRDQQTKEISWISFGYDGLYITDEFDSFIIDWHNRNTEKIKEQLEKDLR